MIVGYQDLVYNQSYKEIEVILMCDDRIKKLANYVMSGAQVCIPADDKIAVMREVVHQMRDLYDPRNQIVHLTNYCLPGIDKIIGIVVYCLRHGLSLEELRRVLFFGDFYDFSDSGFTEDDLSNLNDLGFNFYISNSYKILEKL